MENSPGKEVPVEIVQQIFGLNSLIHRLFLYRHFAQGRRGAPICRKPDQQAEQQQQREDQGEIYFALHGHFRCLYYVGQLQKLQVSE